MYLLYHDRKQRIYSLHRQLPKCQHAPSKKPPICNQDSACRPADLICAKTPPSELFMMECVCNNSRSCHVVDALPRSPLRHSSTGYGIHRSRRKFASVYHSQHNQRYAFLPPMQDARKRKTLKSNLACNKEISFHYFIFPLPCTIVFPSPPTSQPSSHHAHPGPVFANLPAPSAPSPSPLFPS